MTHQGGLDKLLKKPHSFIWRFLLVLAANQKEKNIYICKWCAYIFLDSQLPYRASSPIKISIIMFHPLKKISLAGTSQEVNIADLLR